MRLWLRWNSDSIKLTPDPRHKLGVKGERLAANYLKRKEHYRILYRNFRPKDGGEIDLVCRDVKRHELVFVEVKTRRTEDQFHPSDAVTRSKQDRLFRGAVAWLRLLHDPDVAARFDVVEVVWPLDGKPRIHLIKNAFPAPTSYLY